MIMPIGVIEQSTEDGATFIVTRCKRRRESVPLGRVIVVIWLSKSTFRAIRRLGVLLMGGGLDDR